MINQYLTAGMFKKIAFIAIVAVSGYALTISGNMQNPFAVITDINNLIVSGEQRQPAEGQLPVERADGAQERPEPPEGAFEGGAPEAQTDIQWNRIGEVLFNAWFIIAGTALVMVISGPIRKLMQPLRQRVKMKSYPRRPRPMPSTA